MTLTLDDFDFQLPPELIAQHPASERGLSRLLQVCPQPMGTPRLIDRHFGELPGLLEPGDLLVFNDTRVIKARLFGHKVSGGAVEVLIERIIDSGHALAQIRASKSPRRGSRITLAEAFEVCVGERQGEFYLLELQASDHLADFWQALENHGHLPLPPYISHPANREDEARYQTVYARNPGAVAAPTAGLHFDPALLAQLSARGINSAHLTLHVGAGTFQPVRCHQLSEHRMHSERFLIPETTVAAIAATRAAGKRVIAVGTTSLRALEAAMQQGTLQTGPAETDIFITPGYRFRCVDRLITNFHLPKSTLLMLVSAFAGTDTIRQAYAHAITHAYRFFSYGDAMMLERTPELPHEF